jgi:hypothetical protein
MTANIHDRIRERCGKRYAAVKGMEQKREPEEQLSVYQRVIFKVDQVDHLEVASFANLLSHLRKLNVVWDLMILSYGKRHPTQLRVVEIVIYQDENAFDALTTLCTFLKSAGIEPRILEGELPPGTTAADFG